MTFFQMHNPPDGGLCMAAVLLPTESIKLESSMRAKLRALILIVFLKFFSSCYQYYETDCL